MFENDELDTIELLADDIIVLLQFPTILELHDDIIVESLLLDI
jgi:hypothetical protein